MMSISIPIWHVPSTASGWLHGPCTMTSADLAIDIRHRLVKDGEDSECTHFKLLQKAFQLRAICLLNLHRQHDAVSTLTAAQEIINSLKSEIVNNDNKLIMPNDLNLTMEKHVTKI